jgi:ABC-type cobalt transport system substrate-binding protein
MKTLLQILISILPSIAFFLENKDPNKTGADDRTAQALKAASAAFVAWQASDKKGVVRALESIVLALQTLIEDLKKEDLPKL